MREIPELDEYGAENGMEGKYLVFMVDKENYGLEIKYVTEIIGLQPVTPVPDLPGYIKGVINLRGTVIPIMDVSLKLGGEALEFGTRSRIVVVEHGDVAFGVIVDGVREVRVIKKEQIEPADSVDSNISREYLKGVAKIDDGRLIVLLDVAGLFEIESFLGEQGVAEGGTLR